MPDPAAYLSGAKSVIELAALAAREITAATSDTERRAIQDAGRAAAALSEAQTLAVYLRNAQGARARRLRRRIGRKLSKANRLATSALSARPGTCAETALVAITETQIEDLTESGD